MFRDGYHGFSGNFIFAQETGHIKVEIKTGIKDMTWIFSSSMDLGLVRGP